MTVQRDEAWVKQATPEQIVEARRNGELDLGGTVNELGNPVDKRGRVLSCGRVA